MENQQERKLTFSEKIDHWSDKTFRQNDPHNPKCCFIFPMKCGIIFIGIIALSDLISLSSTTYIVMNMVPAAAIPCFISTLLMATTVMLFFRYYCVDNYDNRLRLVLGCKLMIYANAITFIGIAIASMIHPDLKGSIVVRMFPTYVIPIFLWFYYSIICK